MDLWSQSTKKAHDIQNPEMMLNEKRQRGGEREKLLAAQDSPGVPGEETPQQKWREKLHCPFAELTPKWISISLSQLQSFFFSWSPDHCHHVLCILKLPPLFCKEQNLLDRALQKRLKSSQHILCKICRDKLPKQNPLCQFLQNTRQTKSTSMRLLIATHLDQSNYMVNQNKEQSINRDWLDSSRAPPGNVHFSRVTAVFQGSTGYVWLLHLIQDFQCRATYWAPVELL